MASSLFEVVLDRRHPTDRPWQDDDEPQSVNELFKQLPLAGMTHERLVAELSTVYCGFVRVETTVVEQDVAQWEKNAKLEDSQWTDLVKLHCMLLIECYNFFMVAHHPDASDGLRDLPDKYYITHRMWGQGIQTPMELLRRQLPDTLEHMVRLISFAYDMLTLLTESVPAFETTFFECLGDLSRYRMAIEKGEDRCMWVGVARYWYCRAADKRPQTGRIQHHLGATALSDFLQQLFHYTKSVVCVDRFQHARTGFFRLFESVSDPRTARFMESTPAQREVADSRRLRLAFVNAHGILYGKGPVSAFFVHSRTFLSLLEPYTGSKFRQQGVYIASSNIAAMFQYGQEDSLLGKLYTEALELSPQERLLAAREYWASHSPPCGEAVPTPALSRGAYLAFRTLSCVLQHDTKKDILPYVYVNLAYIWSLALIPTAMVHVQKKIPWSQLVTFLNSIYEHRTNDSKQ
ncbi:hypothetical protein ACJ73_09276 [Blastomyces percursus]|uniref:DNA/RNA-binding domain-containing protein n=1 Tax=Blastomyces percursus TaxID=1658174 RepID=A0A1J9QAI3_9EURO|nr:hypothetical protein ACJ73_09276 [Blastomyces percursus]